MFFLIKKIWRVSIIFIAAIIFSYFLFFLFLHPLNPAFFLGSRLSAAVGASNSATVPVNPINQLALQLEEKQKQLDAREQDLSNRSAAIDRQNNIWNNGVLLVIFIVLAALGGLIVANFYFDRKREKELEFLEKIDAGRIIEDDGKIGD
jgi:hypothetical protein